MATVNSFQSLPMRSNSRSLVGLLILAWVAIGEAPAMAQEPAGRFVDGPLTWTPTLLLRDAGTDSNVFNTPTDPKRDTTASFMPQADATLGLGVARVHAQGAVEFLYFERYQQERAVNGRLNTRVELPNRRIKPAVSYAWAKVRERATSEIDLRAPRTEEGYGAALDTPLASRSTLTLGVSRQSIVYEPGYSYFGLELSSLLDRHESVANAIVRTTLSPLTHLTTEVSVGRDEFLRQPNRDTDNLRANIGLQFAPDAVISGHAVVGYHAMRPRMTAASPTDAETFTGITSSVDLTFTLLDRTKVTGRLARDTTYSASSTQPFYLSTAASVDVIHALFGPVDLLAHGGREKLGYAATVFAAARTDFVDVVGGGLSLRLSPASRWSATIDDATRRSTEGVLFGYSRRRIFTSVTYGF